MLCVSYIEFLIVFSDDGNSNSDTDEESADLFLGMAIYFGSRLLEMKIIEILGLKIETLRKINAVSA